MTRRGFGLVVALVVVFGVLGCVPVGASALAGGRVYEMVSPLYKGGYGVLHIEAVAQNGDSVMFYSPGAFAGASSGAEVSFDYISRRGPSGWATTPSMVPITVMPLPNDKDISRTLSSTLALGDPGTSGAEAFQASTSAEVVLHSTESLDTPANWELAGMILKAIPEELTELRYEDASPDFCHILVSPVPKGSKVKVFLSEEATNEPEAVTQVYELDRGCGGEPASLRIVGLNNKHKIMSPSCEVTVGTEGEAGSNDQSKFNAVADNGREVFFTTCVGGLFEHRQLFVRLDGSRTLEVSKPLGEACSEVPCTGAAARANAEFVGASEDGSRVFFTTTAPLEPATDKDNGNDLYMATIGCPQGKPGCEVAEREVISLVQVSHDPNGGEAGVQGVVRLAPDGSRAYFVAYGDLLSGAQQKILEGKGRAVPRVGADNLYVYDDVSGGVQFIGGLCSGKESSGVVEDTRCPSEKTDAAVWSEGKEVEAQTAGPGGRFLVFGTNAQLVADDTDAARDVYRYDAVTGALERISVGEHGYHANGDDSRFDASIEPGNWGKKGVRYQYELGNRAVSEDGSRIVFRTEEPLSPADTNGLMNVYEWHEGADGGEGSVSLISSGSAEEPDENAVISADGNDVFFVTAQGLVPQDTDNGIPDLYDARVHGGFPPAPAPREPCSSDACQGPLTNPAPLLVPGSVAQAPEAFALARTVVSSKASKTKAKKKAKRRAKRAARARRHGKTVRNGGRRR